MLGLSKKEQLKFINKGKTDKKKLKKECGHLWQAIIKARAGNKCEYYRCRTSSRLNAHHYKHKGGYPGLRYDIDNGICLCYHHHTGNHKEAAHLDPDFRDKILGRHYGYKPIRSEEWLKKIDLKAMSKSKVDLNIELLYLKQEAKKYEIE